MQLYLLQPQLYISYTPTYILDPRLYLLHTQLQNYDPHRELTVILSITLVR